MIAFKSCPRCHGDLLVSKDDGSCLQCGYELRPQEIAAVLARLQPLRPQQLVKAA